MVFIQKFEKEINPSIFVYTFLDSILNQFHIILKRSNVIIITKLYEQYHVHLFRIIIHDIDYLEYVVFSY